MKKRTLGICGALAVAAVVPYVASATSLTMDAAELTADCASGSYTVNAGDSLNLNLDGDVTCSITNNGTLEISGTGTLNGGTNSAIINSGTATIESGSYTGSGNNKHTIINNESGTFEINGGRHDGLCNNKPRHYDYQWRQCSQQYDAVLACAERFL